jgi:hypothetical protein
MAASLELIKDILYLLALYEKEGSPPNLEEVTNRLWSTFYCLFADQYIGYIPSLSQRF